MSIVDARPSDNSGNSDSVFNQHLLPQTAELQVLKLVQSYFNRAKQQRWQFEKQWYMNMAFYFGRHYATWLSAPAGNFDKLVEPPVPPWRVRAVINKIRPIIRTEVAKLLKEKPQAFVIPASSDDDDIAAAKAGEAIFEHLFRELGIHTKVLARAVFWECVTGTGFIKTYWNANLKDFAGQQGAIIAEPVSPFHIYIPDPQEEELENQPYVIHVAAKDPAWVKQVFQKDIQADSGAGAGVLEQKFLQGLGINSDPSKNHVAVKEIWIKPSPKFPDGAVVAWAGDQILHIAEQWPYQHNQYPFIKLDHIPSGRFYATSVIEDLIPLQKELNRTRSQVVEAKNRMSKPQLVAPKGSVDPSKITSEPGLIVFYTPGFTPPQPIPMQNLPHYVTEELERINRDMDDISAQHEISKGSTPPGVTAATAISFLQEQDDTKLSLTIASLEAGVEKMGRQFLSYVQQFWDEQRQIKVLGENNQYEMYAFSSRDLAGNTDLRIETGSATPRSRAAKQAFIMELAKMGAIPHDRMLRYLDMAETGRMYEELQIDSRQAQRENVRIKSGDPEVTVNDWDNHAIHLMEHDNFCKRQEFETADEEIKMAMQQHRELHKQMLAMQMGTMIQPGQQLPGGDPSGQPGNPARNPQMSLPGLGEPGAEGAQ